MSGWPRRGLVGQSCVQRNWGAVDPQGPAVYHGSMVRPAITLLIVTALLCCPLNCAGISNAADAPNAGDLVTAPAAMTPGCACCQQRRAAQDSAAGENSGPLESPSDEGVGGSCLCHGAVLNGNGLGGDGLGDRGLELGRVNSLVTADAFSLLQLSLQRALGTSTAGEDPSLGHGRAICILHQALLI